MYRKLRTSLERKSWIMSTGSSRVRRNYPRSAREVDENVQKYLFSIAQWYAGNLIWSFETPRYFGLELEEVKKSLVVNVKEQGYDVDTELIENVRMCSI